MGQSGHFTCGRSLKLKDSQSLAPLPRPFSLIGANGRVSANPLQGREFVVDCRQNHHRNFMRYFALDFVNWFHAAITLQAR